MVAPHVLADFDQQRRRQMTLDRRDLLLSAGGAMAALALTRTAAYAQEAPAVEADEILAPYRALTNEGRINVINLREIEAAAQKILPPEAFAYISSGAGDEWTMRQNEVAFDNWVIEPEYLSGTGVPDLSATLLGEKLSLPVITAPMGGHGRAHALKEIPTIQGTNGAGTLYVTTTVSHLRWSRSRRPPPARNGFRSISRATGVLPGSSCTAPRMPATPRSSSRWTARPSPTASAPLGWACPRPISGRATYR
jgi:hypothetical protein